MTILDELASYARLRVETKKRIVPLEKLKEMAEKIPKGDFSFEKALRGNSFSFICEIKKASPSKGVIAEDFPYLEIARSYEKAGATCISVLTEPKWFLGKDEYLQEVTKVVKIPCLRKDFTVDEYMIYEAKVLGASAILLICSIITDEELIKYLALCNELGLSAVVEVHDEEEIKRALKAKARIVGVNNRNLKDFSVDINNSKKLRNLLPKEIIFISESGIKTKADVMNAKKIGADGILVGETLMRSKNIGETFEELRG